MILHIICTGTELLTGHTLNTNLQFLGDSLAKAGYAVSRECCVPDRAEEIAAAVRDALCVADVVITSGGLGPTSDDLTRAAIAAALGTTLHLDESLLRAIETYLGPRVAHLPADALHTQALVPGNATPLANRNGTAPGLWCDTAAGKVVIMLPGPPRELQPMFLEEVLPRICHLAPPELARRQFTVCGMAESLVAEIVEPLLQAEFPQVEPAYCARLYQVDVRLATTFANSAQLNAAADRLEEILGRAVIPAETALPTIVGQLLQVRQLRLAIAESCTGGWIAKAVTDTPGSSAWFDGALVAYSNRWKQEFLDVPANLLETRGAVSEDTADAMIRGLMIRFHGGAGIAVTGLAGPEGGTPEKPVGLVFIATAVRNQFRVEKCHFTGNRDSVRRKTMIAALNQLRLQLLES